MKTGLKPKNVGLKGAESPDLSRYPLANQEMTDAIQRMMHVTSCTDVRELETFLGLTYGEIEEAKRRCMLSAHWLLLLMIKTKVSPQWILKGEGDIYLVGADRRISDSSHETLEYLLKELNFLYDLYIENTYVRKRVLALYAKDSRFLG